MMKKFSKALCLLLTAAFAASSLAGCGGGGSGASSGAEGGAAGTGSATGGDTASKEPLAISITLSGNSDCKTSMVEAAAQELISQKMGRELKLNYSLVGGSEYDEKAKMLIASDDITDIFQLPSFYDYTDAAKDGMFTELGQYKDKLPNYFNYVNKVPNGEAGITTGDGNIYIVNGVGFPRFPADSGINSQNVTTYRYDVFEKNGIAIPKTMDELYAAAKKLKEIYPDQYPINTRWKDLRTLFYANHTNNDVYWNGKEYVLGLFDEGYKEAIQFANKLYSEGLLDPEYILETDDTLKSKEMNDQTFIVLADWFTTPGEFTRLTNKEKIFAATFFPDNPKYGTAWQFVSANNDYSLNIFLQEVISSKVKDLDGILEFVNLNFDDEVIRTVNWGIEGTTYVMDEEGNPTFVDELKNAADPWVKGDEYGMRASKNMRPLLSLVDDAKAFVDFAANDYLYYEGELHEEPFEKSPYYLSMPYPENDYIPPMFNEPKLSFTSDESQEKSKILTAIQTYRDEMQSKFVKGDESFDNWDAYMDGIRKMGDVDAMLKIYNDAAARFYANSN